MSGSSFGENFPLIRKKKLKKWKGENERSTRWLTDGNRRTPKEENTDKECHSPLREAIRLDILNYLAFYALFLRSHRSLVVRRPNTNQRARVRFSVQMFFQRVPPFCVPTALRSFHRMTASEVTECRRPVDGLMDGRLIFGLVSF